MWKTLDGVPDEVLSRPLLNGTRLHCIKDLVFHVAVVEDCWLHEDILRDEPLRKTIPAFKDAEWRAVYAAFALKTLLDYWRLVEQSTLAYLATLTDAEVKPIVIVHDAPKEQYQQALQLAQRAKSPETVLVSKLSLARVAIAEGRSASVVNDLRAISQDADRQGMKYLALVSSVDLAAAMINSKDYANARAVLDQALNSSEKLGYAEATQGASQAKG